MSADQSLDPLADVIRTVNGPKWKRIGVDRKAGVLIALWSLRTRQNMGIGEVLDLEILADWCAATGQKIIQLLPVNDTAYDAPPYCSCSAFALNPVYLSLRDIPGVDVKEWEKSRNEFEDLNRTLYWKIRGEKMRLLWPAYMQVKDKLRKDNEFARFCEENDFWLDVYATFMVMKDKHEQQSWKTWTDAAAGTPEFIREVSRRHADEVGFYRFLQWHLDRQWKRVKKYANDRGVFIKGDIPYLLNIDAADVWAWPHYFHQDLAAGCPPDFYNAEGQYWSFPTYRWWEMERDGYRWWTERLRHADKYFDIFRIDHVLGFFRIWSIPKGESAVYGQFVPAIHVTREILGKNGVGDGEVGDLIQRKILLPAYDTPDEFAFKWEFVKDDSFKSLPEHLKLRLMQMEDYFSENDEIQNKVWKDHGKKLLTMISRNTRMLICAEDLGTVPPCVRPTLEELGITKLLVDRWTKFVPTKKEKTRGFQEYWIEPWEYDPISVATPSNHDMPTLRGWWIELGETEEGRKDRWEQFHRFGWRGEMPYQLNAGGVRFILKRNLESESVYAIFSIQDILDMNPLWQNPDPKEDRINLPGTFSDHNWSWRMSLSLEELRDAEKFNRDYESLIQKSGR